MRGECRKCIIEHRCWQAIDFEEKTMKQFRFIVWWKFGYFIVYRWTNTEGTVNLTIIKKKCRNEWLTLWGEAILVRNISPGNSHSLSTPVAQHSTHDLRFATFRICLMKGQYPQNTRPRCTKLEWMIPRMQLNWSGSVKLPTSTISKILIVDYDASSTR